MDPFSLFKKEINSLVKELLLPVEELEKLYSFKEAVEPQKRAEAIARALGFEGDKDLINLIRAVLEGKK